MTANSSEPSPPEATTQQRIITAACAEFAAFGLAGARVDRIARNAGVNKAMIYYHFSSKENLYREVLRDHFRRVTGILKERLIGVNKAEARFEAAAEVYADVFVGMPHSRSLLLRELAHPSTQLLDEIADILIATGLPHMIPQMMSEEIAAGRFRPIDTQQALVSFLSMNIGYFILAPLIERVLGITDSESFVSRRKQALIDLFLHGVKAR